MARVVAPGGVVLSNGAIHNKITAILGTFLRPDDDDDDDVRSFVRSFVRTYTQSIGRARYIRAAAKRRRSQFVRAFVRSFRSFRLFVRLYL